MITTIATSRKTLIALPVLFILGLAFVIAQPGLSSGKFFDNPKVQEELELTKDQIATLTEGVDAITRKQIQLGADGSQSCLQAIGTFVFDAAVLDI